MQLTSTQNRHLVSLRKAIAQGDFTEEGWIVAEGPNLLTEAKNSSWLIHEVFYVSRALDHIPPDVFEMGFKMTELSERAFNSLKTTSTSQGVLALVEPKSWQWENMITSPFSTVVVLDAVQDPGNVGTILRSAEAFGATGVVLGKGCPRISNPKLIRSAAGSLFRIPYLEGLTPTAILERLRAMRFQVISLAASGAIPFSEVGIAERMAVVTGNEGAGLSPAFLGGANVCAAIPIRRIESLNAGVACSIALFEISRRRMAS